MMAQATKQNLTEKAVKVWEDHEEIVGIQTVYLLPVLSPG
jgi:hypothetical protein